MYESLLDLSGIGLHSLGSDIEQLTSLKSIDLSNNRLNLLPATLVNLKLLEKINLSNNSIQNIQLNMVTYPKAKVQITLLKICNLLDMFFILLSLYKEQTINDLNQLNILIKGRIKFFLDSSFTDPQSASSV